MAGCVAARYCCVSQDIASEVLARRIVPAWKVMVVPNGIDLLRFEVKALRVGRRETLGIPLEAPVVGTVGRLTEIKRQDLLIRAFGLMLDRAPDAHLLIVGDGPLGGELRRLADSLDLGDRVHFAGYEPHPEVYLAEMDVFALSSRSEGMPLAVLEAWAAGLPVVATHVGGLPELIQDGQTGILVDTDDEAPLAEALVGLIADPSRARQLGDNGRRRVEADYSLGQMSQAYQRIYLDLACAGQEGPAGQAVLGRARTPPEDAAR
jgi:glycosyltransferase involved in cell wall biosynthesis